MTVREASKRLEISISLTYALIDEGRLSCVRIGRRGRAGKIIIREIDVQKFLDSLVKECEIEVIPKPAPEIVRKKLSHLRMD